MGIPLRGTGSPLGARSTGFSVNRNTSLLTCHIVACGASWGLEGPRKTGPSPTVLGQLQESACCCMPSLSPRGAPSQRQGKGPVEKALQPAVFMMVLKTQPQMPTSGGLDES